MVDYTFPMTIAGDEVLDERQMLKTLGRNMYMESQDSVRFIVIHCTATRCDRDYTAEQLLRDHKARGFRTGGYHLYLRKSGETVQFRRLLEVGAHARGYNRCSIGICYEGGLDADGHFADTRTQEQKQALKDLVINLHELFPRAIVLGHRDLPGAHKACPCFNATAEFPV